MANEMRKHLLINLQAFADDPAGDNPDPAGEPEGDKTDDKNGTGNDKPEDKKEQTFSQEDVSRIAAKESKSATEKILKDLGIDDFENAKDGMEKFREWQDSQKTEAEKLQTEYDKAQNTIQEKEAAYQSVMYENAALKAGVNPESVNDVVALAEKRVTDEVDINAAMKSVIEQYPQFSNVQESQDQEPPKPHFLGGEHKSNGNGPVDPFEAKVAKWKKQ